MAKQKTLYPATIKHGEELTMVDVDIYNLPYGEFDAQDPLFIAGGVVLGKPRGRAYPNLENVIIDGGFDCSEFTIGPDTVLPRGTTALYCLYSIKDLKVLIDKLPDSVGVVVTRAAILNNIKRKDAEALAAARDFMARYPNILVTDGKQGLHEIMQTLDAPKSSSVSDTSDAVVSVASSVPIQTAEWLSDKEVCVICKQKSEIINALSDEEVLRYIKQARSAKARLNIRNQKMHRASDKCEVSCTHQDDIDIVIGYIESLSTANKERAANSDKKATTKASKATKKVIVPAKTSGTDKKLKAIKIKKYIPRSIWKAIQSACGKNTTLLRKILTEVNLVNRVPDGSVSENVYYVCTEDGQKKLKSLPSLKCEGAQCVCQGFEGRKCAQRIIWGVVGTKFIAQHFFAEHDGSKSRNIYGEAINNIDVEKDFAENPEKYLLVSDLLEQMGDRGIAKTDAKPVKPKKSVVKKAQSISETVQSITETVAVESKSVVSNVIEQEDKPTEPVMKRRKRTTLRRYEKVLHRGDTSAQIIAVSCTEDEAGNQIVKSLSVNAPQKSTVDTAQTETMVFEMPISEQPANEDKSDAVFKKVPEWADIYSLHTEYSTRLGNIKTQIAELLTYMSQESDVTEMMHTNQEIGDLLREREKCERALQKIQQMNSKLISMLANVIRRC